MLMATVEEADHSSDELAHEDAVGQQSCQTQDKRIVDALLDISEEDFLKELEPHKYHCYSGWEEAARGWDRVAPMSCLLLAHKSRNPKHEKAKCPAPLSIDPAIPNADIPASSKKSMQLNQHTESMSNTAVAALQKDSSQQHNLNTMPMAMSNHLLEENLEEQGKFRETLRQNRPSGLQKPSHRPNHTVLPIKQFTFLPPVETPHPTPHRMRHQLCSGEKALEGETIKKRFPIFDKKNGVRQTRVDPAMNLAVPDFPSGFTSKFQICQPNPHLFSAISAPIPNLKVLSACVFQM